MAEQQITENQARVQVACVPVFRDLVRLALRNGMSATTLLTMVMEVDREDGVHTA